ncbi:MAG: amidohydrolase, partial [Acidobacteriota bacterium]
MTGLLIEGGTLLGLTEPADIHPDTDLYVEEGRIRATGGEATREAAAGPVERLDARGQWVLPGFVQAHLHL